MVGTAFLFLLVAIRVCMMKRKQRPLIVSSACGFVAKASGKPFARCLAVLANHILRLALLTELNARQRRTSLFLHGTYWLVCLRCRGK